MADNNDDHSKKSTIDVIDGDDKSNSNKQINYENPNYRKLYAKLSINQMMIGGDDHENNEKSINQTESNPFSYDDDDDDDEDDSLDDEEEDDDDEYEDLSSENDENVKQNLLTKEKEKEKSKDSNSNSNSQQQTFDLPDGWERHEDELGSYFWHIPTGTIQRERPYLNTLDKSMIRSDSLVFLDKSAIINIGDYNLSEDLIEEENPLAESKESNQNDDDDDDYHQENEHREQKKSLINRKKIIANMKLTFPETDDDDDDDDPDSLSIENELTFIVHSLGWLDVDESQINSQTGSTVIKRCIYELTTRAENAARCWGPNETQSLILKINSERISLLEPTTSTTLSIQLIREIRMWAVDDNNNFAYVVKDRKNGKPGTVKCHIFHCDDDNDDNMDTTNASNQSSQTAQRLALYLKNALIQIKNRNHNQESNDRPDQLLLKSSNQHPNHQFNSKMENFEFPTPIEEPKKQIHALYIGFIPVSKPMGIEILNMAIEEIINTLRCCSLTNDYSNENELMRPVMITISPSNLIVECQQTGCTLVECRVRFVF